VKRPILGVTMGDPAGVGPEIIARAGAEPAVRRDSRPVVIGAAATMQAALELVGSPLALHAVARVADCRWADGTMEVLDLANVDMRALPRAAVSAAAGKAAYEYIERAVELAQTAEIHGIVTAPINKEALAAAEDRQEGDRVGAPREASGQHHEQAREGSSVSGGGPSGGDHGPVSTRGARCVSLSRSIQCRSLDVLAARRRAWRALGPPPSAADRR